MRKSFFYLCAMCISLSMAAEEFKLSGLFTDNMVLQRETPTQVWGVGKPGSKVTVSIDGLKESTEVETDGKWKLVLPKHEAGGPYKMKIRSKSGTEKLENIYFGDVWVASGQSNMEWKLNMGVNNWEAEVANSDFPEIRFIKVPNNFSSEKQWDLLANDGWKIANPENAGNFSAVAWFFAKNLHLDLSVPIGIIDSTWGGTPVEAWTPAESVLQVDFYAEKAKESMQPLSYWESKIEQNKKNDAEKWRQIKDHDAAQATGAQMPDYDASSWGSVEIPNEEPMEDIVWLRKTFTLSKMPEQAKADFGSIGQIALVFINGEQVYYKPPEDKTLPFTIDPSVLKIGENTMAVRLINDWNNEAYLGKKGHSFMEFDGERISLEGTWKMSNTIEPKMPQVDRIHWNPGFLYNAMIHPIEQFRIKGFIWYQGENNVGEWEHYEQAFGEMIDAWRILWKQGNLPFIFTQLANYLERKEEAGESAWAALRETQRLTLKKPDTGMAVIIDIGDAEDVHPRNKQDVGKRLFLAASHVAYGKDVVYSGPTVTTYSMEGDQITINFEHCGEGIVGDAKDEIIGFSICDEEENSVWAKAVAKKDQVIVTIPAGIEPKYLRYAWADNPACNMKNSEGLPASSFQIDLTDDQ